MPLGLRPPSDKNTRRHSSTERKEYLLLYWTNKRSPPGCSYSALLQPDPSFFSLFVVAGLLLLLIPIQAILRAVTASKTLIPYRLSA